MKLKDVFLISLEYGEWDGFTRTPLIVVESGELAIQWVNDLSDIINQKIILRDNWLKEHIQLNPEPNISR